jgi:16S rRNA (cytosine1402-N4)-methyltransferase
LHEPVLVRQVVDWIQPHQNGTYVDCTVGYGGHTRALLAAGASRVIGIDRDRSALDLAAAALADTGRVTLKHADYRDLPVLLDEEGMAVVDGILVDLGVSSMQLDTAERGFSFRQAGPLDMRMDPSGGRSLAERLATTDAAELADVIWRFGEERHARRVARAILSARDRGALTDTTALASVVRRAAGRGGWQRIDPATRTFQALRIWVNDELAGLDRFLETAARRLAPHGRLVVIAFHSLEDRIVKHTFRSLEQGFNDWRVLTRRPEVPDAEEGNRNVRARSARLRVLEKVA